MAANRNMQQDFVRISFDASMPFHLCGADSGLYAARVAEVSKSFRLVAARQTDDKGGRVSVRVHLRDMIPACETQSRCASDLVVVRRSCVTDSRTSFPPSVIAIGYRQLPVLQVAVDAPIC